MPAMAGGAFPDAVDKTLCQVLHLTPSGRMYAHTLLSLGVSTALVGSIWGRHAARSWALGYIGHLLGDLRAPVPWMYPFVGYDFPKEAAGFGEILRHALTDRIGLGLESVLFAWVVCAFCQPSVKTRLRATPATVERLENRGK